ncbi:MAG: hypothetical protein ACRDPH_12500 [Marmoricola sp.]
MHLSILPSPLLGPATYAPLAEALAARGHPARVAAVSGGSVAAVLAGFGAASDGADVVAAHSNAGRFAAAAADGRRTGRLFMDATLPGVPAPPELVASLRELADEDGVLPGWTHWWPDAEVDALLGDWRAAVESEQGRWPIDFLLTDPPAPAGWEQRCGYLAFGTTYAAELGRARDAGWPTAVLDGHHLHHLAEPDTVADAILQLADRIR